jgi:hypothetical protein
MKINRQRLKEIIKSVMSEEKEYEEFFRSELEKAGFSSPAEMSDAEKREFFNKIDADWDAKNEELTGNQHKLDIDGDGDIEADDLAALRAGKKKEKSSNEGNAFGAAVTKAKKEGDKKFKVGGKAYPVKEQKSKYYVEIDSPREVDSNRVKGEIKSFMKKGARSVDIGLRMNFLTTDPKDMMAKFQKVKNHIYFANDTRRFESVSEGYHVVRKGKQDAWISDKSYENLMKGKDVVGYIIDDEGGHDEVWVSKKDIAKVSKSNDALAKVADKYSKFESVDEGVMKPGKKIKLISGWAGQNQPTKNDKYVIYQLVNNRHFSMRGLRGGMTYLWKAIESTDPHIKVGSTEEIHPKALKQGIKHGFYVMESVKRMSETKFIAFFNGKKHEVEGKDLWDAKQKAITMLKVPKSKVGLLAVVNAGEHERGSFQFENLSPDVAKHMIGIYKGFSLVNGDGTMTYDTPANAKKAAAYLNKNKIAASSDGKYLYIESKTRR